ncbi:MAG: hypothetical protein R3E90_03220 [Marinicella sp.]|nr:hypothetical protein [Xanthomonadales bacterium]
MKKMMLLVLAMGLPLIASANRYNQVEYGRVVEVEPIYQSVSMPEERQVCDRGLDDRYRHRPRTSNAGNAVLGGIIGGAIGNKFGKGRGRDASTALGILIGAGIGANKNNHHAPRQTCYVETYYHQEERFMGYDVTYEYGGELYHTQLNQYPGDFVRLEVDVRVVD